MREIASSANPIIKRFQLLLKKRRSPFVFLEGKKLVQEAVVSKLSLEDVLVVREFAGQEEALIRSLEQYGARLYLISNRLMKNISQVETPPGIVALAKIVERKEPPLPPLGFAALLHGVRDPGNLGTIIRGAEAAGCEYLILSGHCADPYQPKVTRATMGSVFRVPLYICDSPDSLLTKMKAAGVFVYALSSHASKNIFDAECNMPAILVIGSESHGLPEGLKVDDIFFIPMKGIVESLNVAMAAIVSFYYLFHHSGRRE